MQDGIIKATGNSRTIYASLPATYAEFKAAVEAGTQALDISYNAAGWQQTPTFLNKSNLLTDAVAALFGLTPSATPNDALNAASGLIATAQATANGRARVQTGSYTGTGTSGSGNQNSLTFSFVPKLVIIRKGNTDGLNGYAGSGDNFCIFSQTETDPSTQPGSGSSGGFSGSTYIQQNTYSYVYREKGYLSGTTLSWYNTESSVYQLNKSGETYYWLAIG